jgi:hypothetical protein
MKKFAVREVETLKTTAAMYDCGCPGQDPCSDDPWLPIDSIGR